jgi:hypothetical protein
MSSLLRAGSSSVGGNGGCLRRDRRSPPDAGDFTTYQFVGPSQFFDFRFDLWFTNDVRLAQPITNSNLLLSQDVEGAPGPYTSAILEIELFSIDPEAESAAVQLFLLDGNTIAAFSVGVFDFNRTEPDRFFTILHEFTDAQLALFNDNGLNLTRISARGLSGNDFGITRVAIRATVVPAPPALLLLASALVGLGVLRKRSAE